MQFACESALELAARTPEELQAIGGTSATAIGEALVARLIAGGMRISVS